MNYRHAFHAGNFADVFKHVLLARMLVYLMRKDTPLRYMDTHAGIGVYDLAGDEAGRTGEWRGGVGRVLAADKPADIVSLLEPWVEALGPIVDGMPATFPGSPLLAARLLRPQDRLALNELHPQDASTLRRAMNRETRRDDRLRFTEIDAYAALNAWCPPPERRGLVLIDPAFEAADEFRRLAAGVSKALKKWRTGVFAIWYPLKDEAAAEALYADLLDAGAGDVLQLELGIDAINPQGRLIACGLAVVNPPFGIVAEAERLLPWLAVCMAESPRAFGRVQLHRKSSEKP